LEAQVAVETVQKVVAHETRVRQTQAVVAVVAVN
jgi:hypothetical protein